MPKMCKITLLMGVGGAAELALGYLKIVHEIVRKAGGVCISDEVRIGLTTKEAIFGGFDTQGVINMVTMAKVFQIIFHLMDLAQWPYKIYKYHLLGCQQRYTTSWEQ